MDPATGQWSQKDTYSAGNQALHDAQLGNATSNAKIAQSMDMSGYADPVKQFGTLGAANPFSSANYKPPTNAMGGNLLPWDYKSQLPGTGG
jgi:hypothetical protein